MKPTAHVSDSKKKVVDEFTALMEKYPIVGVLNMVDLPAPPLQKMRSQLRKSAVLKMTKHRLIKIAIENVKDKKKGIEGLQQYLGGMPALLFTSENPFKLSRLLAKSKSPAPAKPGQIAPHDIVVNKGPTPFAPGPIIGELAAVGIKSGVEGGKIAIKADSVVVKKGQTINENVAAILLRLGIMPMEVGLDLVAVYENGVIYTKDILSIDDKKFRARLETAAGWAFNLACAVDYPTKETIPLMLAKAQREADSVGVTAHILEKGIIEQLIAQAVMSASLILESAPQKSQ